MQARGRDRLALLAGEEGDRGLRGDRFDRGLERVEVLVLPALDPVGDDEPPAEDQRHRVQRGGNGIRCRVLALKQLDPLGAALALSDRSQGRAALPDPAVIVAVDEVRRLEAGHGL